MNIAQKFRIWRRDHKHITQKEFARALGVSYETVRKIEQGKRGAGRKTITKFAELKARHERNRKYGSDLPSFK